MQGLRFFYFQGLFVEVVLIDAALQALAIQLKVAFSDGLYLDCCVEDLEVFLEQLRDIIEGVARVTCDDNVGGENWLLV